ncbi:MAG TPA: Na+/H+ antiporter subunit G [Paracoccaceae bacterium]|nr:Na+/H+ antiporter subunit G [Paracoccaceae bacterium]HMO72457.1 Na+/H+ antiporter subunit G [Paracoccaceae bacterium]
MNPIWEYLIAGLLVMSGIFGIVGSFGLIKLPDTMTRLHAPTKATTLGVGGVLIASMAHAWAAEGVLSWHELMITLFLFITAPITANFIAKAQIHRAKVEDQLPPTGTGRSWATFEPDDARNPGHPAERSRAE